MFSISQFRHSQPHQVWLPLCPEDGGVPATAGDHHLPAGDLPLLASPTHRAPGGESRYCSVHAHSLLFPPLLVL